MICDTLEHLTLYQGFHKNLDTAITFLMACDLNTLPLGRTEVDGDTVFINVGWGYETAPGTEVKPYAPDIGFQDSPDAVFGTLGGGRFVLFFPGELHKPGVAQPDCRNVRKAVVKIRMEDKYHG